MRPPHRIVAMLAAAAVAAAAGTSLGALGIASAATTARSCSTLTLNAGRYGGVQAVRVVTLGRVSCGEGLHLAKVYWGKLAANRCGRVNNFCNLNLPGGWSCGMFFATESKEAGGASAGCFRASNGAKVRFYATAAHAAVASRAHAADASWTVVPTPGAPGAVESLLTSVSCVSASSCMAVGNSDDAHPTLDSPQPQNPGSFSESWDGASWTVEPIAAAGPYPVLRRVSCASATFCVAVGYTEEKPGYPAGQRALLETWDGAAWHMAPRPATALPSSVLNDVACTSSSYCVAVGTQEKVVTSGLGFRQYVLVDAWNGTRWIVQRMPRAARYGEELLGVSCASRACMAVGSYNANHVPGVGDGQPLAEHWDGRRWTVDHLSDRNLYFPELKSVSCVSRSFCLAVGQYETSQNATAAGPYAARWNGKRWTEARGGLPKYAPLYGVSCVTTSFCLAAGQYNSQLWPKEGSSATLIEAWNGSQWGRSATPAVPNPTLPEPFSYQADNPGLTGISCLASVGCTAVGAQGAGGLNGAPLAQSAAGAPAAVAEAPAVPAPVLGHSADVRTVSGSVSVQLPGTHVFVPLTSVSRVPLGTIVDATNGTVQLTSAADARGHTATGQFYGGAFRVAQRRAPQHGGHGVELTILRLTGGTEIECPAAGARAAAVRKRRRAKLWGKTNGPMRSESGDVTAGRNGDPTWLTEETCTGTLVKVTQGVVSVENRRTHKTAIVTAGHSLFTASKPSSASTPGATSSTLLWSALGKKVLCGLAEAGLPPNILCHARPIPAPAGTTDQEGAPGYVVLDFAGGPPRLARVSVGDWYGEPHRAPVFKPLRSGTTWRLGGITCTISDVAVRCANRSNHGFTITTASYSAF